MQENEKRKNMTEALVRDGLNTLCLECLKIITGKLDETDMLQVILHNRQGQSGSHCFILNLKTSSDLLLFMALGTKDHILCAK